MESLFDSSGLLLGRLGTAQRHETPVNLLDDIYNQTAPYLRGRQGREKWQQAAIENSSLQRRLKDIQTRPRPKTAPWSHQELDTFVKSRSSLFNSRSQSAIKDASKACKQLTSTAIQRDRRTKDATKSNRRLFKRLNEIYAFNKGSSLFSRVKCNSRWRQRTALFSPAVRNAASTNHALELAQSCRGIPKTLAVANCAGA